MKNLKIILFDSGFVYLGYPERVDCPILGASVRVKKARNIRRWGTDKGLGQLANIGQQPNTVLDYVGTITVPLSKTLKIIELTEEAVNTYE